MSVNTRRVAARYPSVGLELTDPGVLLDIDTEADLAALQARAVIPSTTGQAER